MQIQNNLIMTSNIGTNPSQPNVGDVLQVTVKEWVNNQDAVVSMKGATSTVTFEGKVPEQDKVFVEVTGKTSDGSYTVKVSDRSIETFSQQKITQNTDSQVSEAVKAFTSRGMTVTKESANVIKEFLINGNGTTEQKMDTIRMMAQKQISISDITLKSVNEALNGKPLSQSLLSVLDEIGVKFEGSYSSSTPSEKSLMTVRTEVQREPDVAKSVKIVEDFLKSTNLNEESKKTLENSVSQAKRLSQVGQTVNAKVQLVQNLVAIEKKNILDSNMAKSLTQAKAVVKTTGLQSKVVEQQIQVEEDVKTTSLPLKVMEQLEKTVKDAAKLQQSGQSVQAKSTLTNALTQIEAQAQLEATSTAEVIRQVKEKVTQEPNLTKALDQVKEVVNTVSLPSKVAEQLVKAVQDTEKLEQMGQTVQARVNLTNALTQIEVQAQLEALSTTEMVRQVKEKVVQEPNLIKALDQVKEVVNTASLPLKVVDQLEKTVKDITKLQANQNTQARNQLTNAFTQMEQETQVMEVQPKEVISQLKDIITQELDIKKAIEQTKEAMKTPGLPQLAVDKLQQAVQEATKLQGIGYVEQAKVQLTGHIKQLLQSLEATVEPTAMSDDTMKKNHFANAVRDLIKDIQKEPSLAKVLDKTKVLMNEHPTNEFIEELKQTHQRAQQLEGQGRELAARRELTATLDKINQTSQPARPNENVLSQAEQYVINEVIQTLKLDSQNVMVTEISKKLSQMAIDFRQLKREITKNLDNVSKMLENKNILPQANVKQILESTIHKLDNTILKSDFLLYTDMSTEKKLLSASSQLAEAKKLLVKGEIAEANKLVKEVKMNIENIIFKPSDVKVKHFVLDKLGLENFTATKQVASSLEQAVQPFSSGESSSRQMYEALRKLGLTHEHEAGFSLVSKSGTPVDQQQNENVKAALMKMMQNEELKPRQMQQVEQAVQNITGQQLLNKQDSSGMQNLFFQLPYLIDKQVENIKVYVNSRKEGEKVDWENCSIYFVLETKKLGDIGVHLSSSEKNVSLTFRSNKDKIDEKVAGLTELTQERFKEIGYNLNTMNVQSLREQTARTSTMEEEKSSVELKPTFTEKGYDFSI